MRVTIADPPAYTLPYDHALAAALARAGTEVELLTSPFRFGEAPEADGYAVRNVLYPISSRLHRSRVRIATKALEHPVTLARLAAAKPDVLHVQWLAAPEADTWLLHTRAPLVFTAHDLLPRRTATKTRAWRRLFGRFDAVVAHSESGRRALVDFGVGETKLRVIPHPVFRSDPARADDGSTALVLGTLRPYKGVPDAVQAVLRVPGARLLVAGDPRIPLQQLQTTAGARAEWRLGYLPPADLERALGEATVALFPYRAELDQSGALLAALGAGLPAVAYDVGGLGEVVRTYGAGRVVRAGDVDALAAALDELLHDTAALGAARAGAARARDELTWDASAASHLDLYRDLVS